MSAMSVLPEWAVAKAIRTFGAEAAAKINENPYVMHQLGVKLDILDRLATQLKISTKNNVHRSIAIAEAELDRELLNGNCYMLIHTLAVKAKCRPEELALDGTIIVEGKRAMLTRAHAAEVFILAWVNDAF